MAGEITHVVLAQKYYSNKLNNRNATLFFVGVIFPDIRYYAHLPREKTHLRCQNLSEIKLEKSDFLAGVKFHNWTDVRRNHWWREKIFF